MFTLLSLNILMIATIGNNLPVPQSPLVRQVALSRTGTAGIVTVANTGRIDQANLAWNARMVRTCSANGTRPVC
jgi:hypothetical protein